MGAMPSRIYRQLQMLHFQAIFVCLVISYTLPLASSSISNNDDTLGNGIDTNIHPLLRTNDKQDNSLISDTDEEIIPWYHPSKRLLKPSTTCPWPDDITSLTDVRSGQYGSMTGDCFYMYYDSTICDVDGDRCPLYIYVDGTENAEDIDERDSTYMIEMARRGYIAVTVDYDDMALNYIDGCDGFHEKSKKIFDGSIKGSVIHQLCYDDENDFGHRDMIPVDCELGVVVNGYSQGSHVASLAGNYAPTLVTAGLFWANGNFNTACAFEWPRCLFCVDTDVSCMNSNSIILPKEKRRNIVGAQDSFFGACENYFGGDHRVNVIDQIRAVSGYSCAYERDNCFRRNTNKAGYFVVDGKGHNFMDVRPWSDFMDEATVWGLPQNFDWLAEQGRVQRTNQSSPRSGICSANSGSTAGDACTSNSDCQCNRRQLNTSQSSTEHIDLTFATNDSAHRGLKKDKEKGGDKNNPAAPTPTANYAPSSDFCGCVV